jgi:hypothetical protein
MRILLDADTLLEYILHRSMFINKVENLEEILQSSLTQICISKLGSDKINSSIKALHGEKASREMAKFIKTSWKVKILRTSQSATQEARKLPLLDFESAVEVVLADSNRISAVVTHKPEDFSGMELNIMTLPEFQRRKSLETCLSRTTRERPAVLFIPKEVAVLNELYALPSYTSNMASKSKIKQSSATYSKEDFPRDNDIISQSLKSLSEKIESASRIPEFSRHMSSFAMARLKTDTMSQSLKLLSEKIESASRIPGFNRHMSSFAMVGLKTNAMSQSLKLLSEKIESASRIPGFNRHMSSFAMVGLKTNAMSQSLKSLSEKIESASRIPEFNRHMSSFAMAGLRTDTMSQSLKLLSEKIESASRIPEFSRHISSLAVTGLKTDTTRQSLELLSEKNRRNDLV